MKTIATLFATALIQAANANIRYNADCLVKHSYHVGSLTGANEVDNVETLTSDATFDNSMVLRKIKTCTQNDRHGPVVTGLQFILSPPDDEDSLRYLPWLGADVGECEEVELENGQIPTFQFAKSQGAVSGLAFQTSFDEIFTFGDPGNSFEIHNASFDDPVIGLFGSWEITDFAGLNAPRIRELGFITSDHVCETNALTENQQTLADIAAAEAEQELLDQ